VLLDRDTLNCRQISGKRVLDQYPICVFVSKIQIIPYIRVYTYFPIRNKNRDFPKVPLPEAQISVDQWPPGKMKRDNEAIVDAACRQLRLTLLAQTQVQS
jgi:hypothetical protein